MRIIGGEFEIEPCFLNKDRDILFKGSFFSSGRSALYTILSYIKNHNNVTRLYLPDYLCESIIKTVEYCGIKFEFYLLDKKLQLDREIFLKRQRKIINGNFSILLINYFGILNLESTVNWLKSSYPECVVIQDNVQAFFDMQKKTEADFVFTSFRKTLPVPDGALVISRNKVKLSPLVKKEHPCVLLKLLGGILKQTKKYSAIDDKIYLHFFSKGESLLDIFRGSYQISDYSRAILVHLRYDKIKEKRRKNAGYIRKNLLEMGIREIINIDPDKIPLFIPVFVKERDEVRRKLFEEKIFLPIHWPLNKKYLKKMSTAAHFSENELSIIVDQRYGMEDMKRIIEILKKLKVKSANI